jgi:hypothetical protein
MNRMSDVAVLSQYGGSRADGATRRPLPRVVADLLSSRGVAIGWRT